VTRRRGRRRKKLLDDLEARRGYSHLKEEALDRILEEAVDLSSDRLLMNEYIYIYMYISIYLSIYIIYIIHKNVVLYIYKHLFYSLDRTAG
jgi:hypothetical protein